MPDEFARCPKVELHLHLEGAIPLDTLWLLLTEHGGDPDVTDPGRLAQRMQYTSFEHFLDIWWWMTGFVRRETDFELAAAAVAADLASQNIVYAEASFSPTDFERHGLTPQQIATAIRRGLDRVPDTQVVLNCDLVRNTGPERAATTLQAVLEVAGEADIRGITIGGSERDYPPALFEGVYQTARECGMRLTAHAGEEAGPSSVRDAIELLGVERIGHGVRVVEDHALLDRVISEAIPLEVCPTSNLRTGVVGSWEEHPIGTLLERGAYVTVSSDDPTFFHTSVADELRELAHRYNADPAQLTQRAIAASWMTEDEKIAKRDLVTQWWAGGHRRVG
jgi:adenosine deaminase